MLVSVDMNIICEKVKDIYFNLTKNEAEKVEFHTSPIQKQAWDTQRSCEC